MRVIYCHSPPDGREHIRLNVAWLQADAFDTMQDVRRGVQSLSMGSTRDRLAFDARVKVIGSQIWGSGDLDVGADIGRSGGAVHVRRLW